MKFHKLWSYTFPYTVLNVKQKEIYFVAMRIECFYDKNYKKHENWGLYRNNYESNVILKLINKYKISANCSSQINSCLQKYSIYSNPIWNIKKIFKKYNIYQVAPNSMTLLNATNKKIDQVPYTFFPGFTRIPLSLLTGQFRHILVWLKVDF